MQKKQNSRFAMVGETAVHLLVAGEGFEPPTFGL